MTELQHAFALLFAFLMPAIHLAKTYLQDTPDPVLYYLLGIPEDYTPHRYFAVIFVLEVVLLIFIAVLGYWTGWVSYDLLLFVGPALLRPLALIFEMTVAIWDALMGPTELNIAGTSIATLVGVLVLEHLLGGESDDAA